MPSLPSGTVTCETCGQQNPAAFRFCGACGAALSPAAGSEVRKTVTILFGDLVGSTALGERSDPEVLRRIMTRYHADVRTILERHGGTVEKFVGDAAMAVFGLPQVHEDDALRAVRAAVELRDAVANQGLEVRIGINTGEVMAAGGETLVTGDAVNVAARLEQAANPGEILIGVATERLVRMLVRSEVVAPLALKGKAGLVPAFRVVQLLEDVPSFTRPIEAPFVGRDEELSQLEAALGSAIAARAARLATIVGPPGIGKSRLVRELLGRAPARVLVGRCLSYGEGITYWPLGEIASQVGEVEAALAGTAEGDLAAARVAAAIGSTATPASPEEIAWGFRRLLEAMASDMPLVVVFDDIHWAEPVMLDLIEYVAAFARDVPLLLLCTARPDLFEQRPAWMTPKPNATVLTLQPLSEADSGQLVAELAHLPAEAQTRIVEAAEGNPLFVEQLVAMWAETGNGELEVPPTLRALLAARIDRLANAERAVVARGSVEGRLFHRGAVTALLPEPDRRDVGGHLLTLIRKELIRPDRAFLPGDDGYRFAHILVRDAAYEAIPKRLRASLHQGYADWLAARLGEEAPPEIVGYHLEQAYRYTTELGVVDGDLGAQAAALLAAAAKAALARSDVAAAVNLYGRAAELVPERPERPGLLAHLGGALQQAGDVGRAEEVLEQALAAAVEAADPHVEWMARIARAALRLDTQPEGAVEGALREGRAAIKAREEAADHELLARAWRLIAEVHHLRGQASEELDALDRAMGHATQAGDLALQVRYALRYAPIFIFGPAPVAEGLRYVDELTERLGHIPAVREFALHVSGHLRARLGESHAAMEAIAGYRHPMRDRGEEPMYALTSVCVWDVCLWAGLWQQGESALREAHEISARLGNRMFQSTAAIHLAECLYLQGRLGEVRHFLEEGETMSASDDVFNAVKVLEVKARLAATRGELDRAETLAREALAKATETEFLELAAGVWLNLATILREADDPGAPDAANEALRLYERKGNLVGVGRVRAFLQASPQATERGT